MQAKSTASGAEAPGSAAFVGADILGTAAAGPLAIRGGMLRVAAYVASVGLGVTAAAVLLRHLGPGDFGRYTTVTSLVLIATALTEAGMTTIGVRQYAILAEPERSRFMRSLLGLRLVLTAVGAVAAVAFAAAVGYDEAMVAGTALAASGMILGIVQATYGVALQAQLRLGWISVIDIARQLVAVVLVVGLVAAGASLLPFLAVFPLTAGVVLAMTVPLVRGRASLVPGFHRQEWRRLLALTVPFAAANAVGALYGYLAIVVLSLASTQDEVGYFGAAFRIFVILAGVASLIVASAFPVLARAARDDRSRLAYALERLWEICLITGAGVGLCTAVGAPFVIDVVAGPGYEAAVDVLRVLAAALLGSYVLATWGFGLLSLGRYRGVLIANFLALAVSGSANALLIPRHEALGAAFATLAGELTLAAGYGFFLLREPKLRPRLRVVPRVIVAAGAGAAILLVPAPPVVRALLAGFVYAAILIATRAIPEEVGEAVRARLRS